MANETFALLSQPQPETVGEDDYQSFCEALGSSARGRAFLHEYARRNRHADTEVVLAALSRFEAAARSQTATPEAERIRQDLRALLDTIRAARPQIDTSPGAIKAATLSALIDFVQARIEAVAANGGALLAQAALSEVPPLDQPELPIPSPAAAIPPSIALVRTAAAPPDHPRATNIIPEVNFIDTTFVKPAPVEPPAASQSAAPGELPQPAPVAQPAPARETAISALAAMLEISSPVAAEPHAPKTDDLKLTVKPVTDPLAAIMALTEEERIALFT